MTFEAWMKEDKFKTQVIVPFEQYLKAAFRKHFHLHGQYRLLTCHSRRLCCQKIDGARAKSTQGRQ
jgi:hypothetical protein